MRTPNLKTILRTLCLGTAFALLTPFMGSAAADPLACGANRLAVSDVIFAGDSADDCWGANNSGQESVNPWKSGVFMFLASDTTPGDSNSATGNVSGFLFTLSATAVIPGTWTLEWKDPGIGSILSMVDLVVVLSDGKEIASYLFDNVAIAGATGGAGKFRLSFSDRALDHFAIYYANPDMVARDLRAPNGVPEPGALLLLGIGLLTLTTVRAARTFRP